MLLSRESKCYFCHTTFNAASETLSSSADQRGSWAAAAPSGREEVVDAGAADAWDVEDGMLVAETLGDVDDEELASTVVLLGGGGSVRVTVVEVMLVERVLRPARVSGDVEPMSVPTPLKSVNVGSCGLLCRATSTSPARVALAECAWQTSRHTASQRMLRRSMLSDVDDGGGEARMSMPAQEVKSAASGSASLRGKGSTLRRALSASRSARRPRVARAAAGAGDTPDAGGMARFGEAVHT